MRQKLTTIAIDRLPHPDSGSIKYWDTVLPGFGIRVSKRSKSFFIMFGKVDELLALCHQLKESLQQAQKIQIHLTDAVVENAL